MRDYLELTKPRITLLILICVWVGYCFGWGASFHSAILAHALLGTALLASGTSALNQWYEWTPMQKCAAPPGAPCQPEGSREGTGSFSA
jgi:protoheme IX farnesyltransferase